MKTLTVSAILLTLCLSLSTALADEPTLSDTYSTDTITHIEYDMFGFMVTERPKSPIENEKESYPVDIKMHQPDQPVDEKTNAVQKVTRHDKISITLIPSFSLYNFNTWGDYGARMDLIDIPLVSVFSTERDLRRSSVHVVDTPFADVYRYNYHDGHTSMNFVDVPFAEVYTQQISASGENNWQFVHVPMVSVMDYRSSAAKTSWEFADVPFVTVADYSSTPDSTSFELLDIPLVDVLEYDRKRNDSFHFTFLDAPLVEVLEIESHADGSGSWRFLDLPIIGPVLGGSQDHLKILFLEL